MEEFNVQIGDDETAEELTISVKLGGWGYSLRNKETGEIIRVTGNDNGETISATLKIVDTADEFLFIRELATEKASVRPGGETAVWMRYGLKFNKDRYTVYYGDEEHFWYLGIESCAVSGNTSENTKIENRNDYANTRYLVLGEDETAEELTITMECRGWTYWVKDKETGELFRIHSNEKETLQIVVKTGAEEEISNNKVQDDEIYIVDESDIEDRAENNTQQVTFTNTVTTANGTKTVSTIDGIYQVTNIAGTAVITPKEQVEAAAGAVTGESKVRLYVCNNQDKSIRAALEEAARSNGKKAFTTFHIDMYVISKAGQVDKVHNTMSKVRVVIGISDEYKKAEQPYTIGIIGADGTFHILEDLDNDPDTITIETDQFGVMALMN